MMISRIFLLALHTLAATGTIAVVSRFFVTKEFSSQKIQKTENNDGKLTNANVFAAENLLKSKKVMCGGNKCFFRLKSDPEIGYLVTPAQRLSHSDIVTKDDWWRTLHAAWELAKRMARDYNIEHFGLDAPRNISIPHELATRMNRNLWRESKSVFITEDRFVEGSNAYIQEAKAASKPNLLIGCGKTKIRGFWRDADVFMKSFRPNKNFVQRFAEDMKKARAMMRGERCLIQDFQVILDTTGQLNHLDFDRCFTPEDFGTKRVVLKKYEESCYAQLDDMEKYILKAFDKVTGLEGEEIVVGGNEEADDGDVEKLVGGLEES